MLVREAYQVYQEHDTNLRALLRHYASHPAFTQIKGGARWIVDGLCALGGSALVPLLSHPLYAQERTPPTRLIVFYQPNGTKKELWTPSGNPTETEFELGPILEPLNAFKENLVLVDGLTLSAAKVGPGGPHQRGMAAF